MSPLTQAIRLCAPIQQGCAFVMNCSMCAENSRLAPVARAGMHLTMWLLS